MGNVSKIGSTAMRSVPLSASLGAHPLASSEAASAIMDSLNIIRFMIFFFAAKIF